MTNSGIGKSKKGRSKSIEKFQGKETGPTSSELSGRYKYDGDGPRFMLHIDIDATYPLRVVSGSVGEGRSLKTSSVAPHFIGCVTSDKFSGEERELVVEGFQIQLPNSKEIIDMAKINIKGGKSTQPTAEVTFVGRFGGSKQGPYSFKRESRYFREVEVEIDREENAEAVEPYNTHHHPVHPPDLPEKDLTLEKVFAEAGIRIVRSPRSDVIKTREAGADGTWNTRELQDAMEKHWSAFSNKPQWKMWIFLAERFEEDPNMGGLMFDCYDPNSTIFQPKKPGDVDRQGVAIFTKCDFQNFIEDNPPKEAARSRELFFNYIHETGHAFNLAHCYERNLYEPWIPPAWWQNKSLPSDTALSFMNYPDLATRAKTKSKNCNAIWFYNNFRFRFIDDELLFLRHAPEKYVEMGNEAMYHNHARIYPNSLDTRLELVIRSRKNIVEFGESVFLELRLRNIGNKPVVVHGNLDPRDVFVQIAVTNPAGERRPFIPFIHTWRQVQRKRIRPGEAVYASVNLTTGKFGFPFNQPGPYRIEATYRNIDGNRASAVMQLWVRHAANNREMRVVSELFNARIGRVLYVGGSRVMEDVNEKIDWVLGRLSEKHPARYYLSAVKGLPLIKPYKVLGDSYTPRLLDVDPKNAEASLAPLIDNMEAAADSLGHIMYREMVDAYTKSALESKKRSRALEAQKRLLNIFEKRRVLKIVTESIQKRVKELR